MNCTLFRVHRAFTVATYKKTPLGQLQTQLNATIAKKNRRKARVEQLQSTIKTMKEAAGLKEPTEGEKLKLKRNEYDLKQCKADFTSLNSEVEALKSLQAKKREEIKKKKDVHLLEDEDEDSTTKKRAEAAASLNECTNRVDEKEVPFNQM